MDKGKYFMLNAGSGIHSPSNRYGGSPRKFVPYVSGFSHNISPSPIPVDNIYAIQPHKFDGYSQFPRPKVNSSLAIPYADTFNNKRKKSPNDLTKIPTPLKHLSLSSVYDKNITPPKFRRNFKRSILNLDTSSQSIEKLKTSFEKKPKKEIKTAIDLENKLMNDDKNFKPFSPMIEKEERTKMKGYFMRDFTTSNELYEKEKAIRQITNSAFFQRLKHDELLDRKNLEKRKERLFRFK